MSSNKEDNVAFWKVTALSLFPPSILAQEDFQAW